MFNVSVILDKIENGRFFYTIYKKQGFHYNNLYLTNFNTVHRMGIIDT